MNSQQKTLIRILQLILYPIAAIMTAVFVWNFVINPGDRIVEITDEPSVAPESDPIALAVVLLFWVVFIALLFEFLAREIFRLRARSEMGRVILEIGASSGALR